MQRSRLTYGMKQIIEGKSEQKHYIPYVAGIWYIFLQVSGIYSCYGDLFPNCNPRELKNKNQEGMRAAVFAPCLQTEHTQLIISYFEQIKSFFFQITRRAWWGGRGTPRTPAPRSSCS